MYVYCIESFVHIECYSDCSRRENHLIVAISGEDICCSVVFGTLVGVSVFGII